MPSIKVNTDTLKTFIFNDNLINPFDIYDKIIKDNINLLNEINYIQYKILYKKLNCYLCNDDFSVTTSLTRHYKNVTHKKYNVKCDKCDKLFHNEAFLYKHMIEDHILYIINNDKKFKCYICNSLTSSKNAMTKHYKEKHYNTEIISCKICKSTFTNISNLKNHMIIKHTENKVDKTPCKYNCKLCSYSNNNSKQFAIHLYSQHNIIKDGYTERFCDNCHKFKSILADKYNDHHKRCIKRKIYKCKFCDKVYKSVTYLNKHLSKIHPDKYHIKKIKLKSPSKLELQLTKKSPGKKIKIKRKSPGKTKL